MTFNTIKNKSAANFKTLNFTIYRPGGNDTCLIDESMDLTKEERNMINNKVMQLFPNVEQVGFLKKGNPTPRLEMAGGEFCGNATRSAAMNILKEDEEGTSISVSGTKNKLLTGISRPKIAWAEMPIRSDPSCVQKIQENEYKVQLDGIAFLVYLNAMPNIPEESLKQEGLKLLQRKGLTEFPASGIIYATELQNKTWRILPIVYVRNIKTLFVESSCGSGTTALGQVLAMRAGKSIQKLPIQQPSGMPIEVSVEYDGKRFSYAEIGGSVEIITSGKLYKKDTLLVALEQIQGKQNIADILKKGELLNLYQDVFSKPPYCEFFSEEEIRSFFINYIDNGILFLAKNEKEVIGFSAAIPLVLDPQVAKIIGDRFPVERCWYMADLGVAETWRKNGIGRKLVEMRIEAIPKGSIIIMRTTERNVTSRAIYTSLGFTLIDDCIQEVNQLRQDGKSEKDSRIFMYVIKN